MYRYREPKHAYSTVRSLDKAEKHLSKIGPLTDIICYRYFATRWDTENGERTWVHYGKHEAVMFRGTNGTVRLNGLLWGYTGEGPRGFATILTRYGFHPTWATNVAYNTNRDYDRVGIDLHLNFDPSWGILYKRNAV